MKKWQAYTLGVLAEIGFALALILAGLLISFLVILV